MIYLAQLISTHRQKVIVGAVAAALLLIFISAILLPGRLNHIIYWPIPTDWIEIPAGSFKMGSSVSDAQAQADEFPQHTVFLGSYKIGKYEVTNQQYLRCVKAGNCEPPNNKKFDQREYRRYPVNDIRWVDAQNYCNWTGGRLPTEAEWEKASSGINGKTMPWLEGIYCWQMNYGSKCFEGVTNVGTNAEDESHYGTQDMAGNAWEWVADWYDAKYYSVSPITNPQGPDTGKHRVLRGASWRSYGGIARSADRDSFPPEERGYNIGFRCVKQ